jgi:hypothetical protein
MLSFKVGVIATRARGGRGAMDDGYDPDDDTRAVEGAEATIARVSVGIVGGGAAAAAAPEQTTERFDSRKRSSEDVRDERSSRKSQKTSKQHRSSPGDANSGTVQLVVSFSIVCLLGLTNGRCRYMQGTTNDDNATQEEPLPENDIDGAAFKVIRLYVRDACAHLIGVYVSKANLGVFARYNEQKFDTLGQAIAKHTQEHNLSDVLLEVDVSALFFVTNWPLSTLQLAAKALLDHSILADAVYALFYAKTGCMQSFIDKVRPVDGVNLNFRFFFETGRSRLAESSFFSIRFLYISSLQCQAVAPRHKKLQNCYGHLDGRVHRRNRVSKDQSRHACDTSVS